MKTPTYHVGLVKRGRRWIFQYSQTVDGLDCETREYFGKREGTKEAARFRLKDTRRETLAFLNNRYPPKVGRPVCTSVGIE